MNHQKYFNCQYPIIAAAMNQVSDWNLAVVCHQAGIFPSISTLTYSKDYIINYNNLEEAIQKFQDRAGTNKILISVSIGDLLGRRFFDLVNKFNIENIEIIGNDYIHIRGEEKELYAEYLSNKNLKLFSKIVSHKFVNTKHMHGVILKSSYGAGRSFTGIDEEEELKKIKELDSSFPVVMSGGIGSKDDVKKYLDLGCIAVAVGTLLAASEESCISKETKLKMVESTWKDVTRLKTGAQQNALVFSTIETDDFNNTDSLNLGMKDPTQGHVFAGRGINNIKSILPVKDIVQLLVDGL